MPRSTPAAARSARLGSLLAGVDASTWFCWVQHQTPLRTLEGAAGGAGHRRPVPSWRTSSSPALRSGRLLGAVAFAHVRRPGPPEPGGDPRRRGLAARRRTGLGDLVGHRGRRDGDGPGHRHAGRRPARLLLPAGGRPARSQPRECTPGPALPLLAMSGTHTRPVRLDGVHVPDDRVGAILDRDAWLAADAVRTADANPAAFGVARGAIAELAPRRRAARADDAHARLGAALVRRVPIGPGGAPTRRPTRRPRPGAARPPGRIARPGGPSRDERGHRPFGGSDAPRAARRSAGCGSRCSCRFRPRRRRRGRPPSRFCARARWWIPTYSDIWPAGEH